MPPIGDTMFAERLSPAEVTVQDLKEATVKNLLVTGIVIALLGAGMLIYQGITYTTKEEVLKIGPITAIADKEHTIGFPPLVSWALLAAGIGLIIAGARKK
jgi:hypothetical protein